MKTARIAIFLTGMIGLGMGGIMSLSSIQSQQEEAVLRTNETLKTQAQGYVDQFFGIIDSVRTGGTPNYVLNQFSVKMNQGVPSEIESSKKDTVAANTTPTANNTAATNTLNNVIKNVPENVDLALEDRLISALKNQVSLSELQLSKYSIGTFDLSEIGTKEGIFIASPSEVDAKQVITKINVILIDPAAALTSFPKLGNSKLDRNAFLIGKTGKVLAHTSSAYVGTDLRKAEGLRASIENLFVGAQTGLISNYHAVDGTKEQVAFVRAGTLPFAIGVEQKAIPAVMSIAWFEEQLNSGAARKGLGMIFVVIAASLALFSAVSMTFNRRIQNELKLTKFQNRNQNYETERNAPPAMNIPLHNISNTIYVNEDEVAKATEEFTNSRNQIENEVRFNRPTVSALSEMKSLNSNQSTQNNNKISVHRDYSEELASRVKSAQTPEQIEIILTQLSSEMSESATMFFRYNRRLQNLTLGTVAGNVKIQNNALLQAYVRKDIEEQVEAFATEGKVASLNNYGPVSKMMIAHMNVAHFEAWAVTSEADVSGTPKLVGVLVILNAGFRSAQSRPVLSKMLREAGNYLYAQTNKVGSRTRSIKPTPTKTSELNA
jgi:hypothetical protein